MCSHKPKWKERMYSMTGKVKWFNNEKGFGFVEIENEKHIINCEIIENELSKSYEEINAEIIDECCLALESVYSLLNGETVELKEIKLKEIQNKKESYINDKNIKKYLFFHPFH